MNYTNGTGITQHQSATDTATAWSAAQTERTAPVSPWAASGTMPGSAGERKKLTGFGGAPAQVLRTSDVRLDKVRALKQAIASGDYAVSRSDVADKVIRSLLSERVFDSPR